jgi:hypothetical protein
MKHGVAFLSIAIVSAFLSLPALAAPKLTFEKPVYDFQKTEQGTTLTHSFMFRNTGNEPATIERVGSSCGCTVANVSERVIQPGKTGEIKASFDSSDFSGPITKEIFVYVLGLQKPAYTLTLKGVVIEELTVTPRPLNLGEIKAGSSKTGEIKLLNTGKKTIRITAFKTSMPQIKASAKKLVLKPGESTSIQVSVAPTGGNRFLGGFITISTDSRGKSEKTVQVYAAVRK